MSREVSDGAEESQGEVEKLEGQEMVVRGWDALS